MEKNFIPMRKLDEIVSQEQSLESFQSSTSARNAHLAFTIGGNSTLQDQNNGFLDQVSYDVKQLQQQNQNTSNTDITKLGDDTTHRRHITYNNQTLQIHPTYIEKQQGITTGEINFEGDRSQQPSLPETYCVLPQTNEEHSSTRLVDALSII